MGRAWKAASVSATNEYPSGFRSVWRQVKCVLNFSVKESKLKLLKTVSEVLWDLQGCQHMYKFHAFQLGNISRCFSIHIPFPKEQKKNATVTFGGGKWKRVKKLFSHAANPHEKFGLRLSVPIDFKNQLLGVTSY